MALFALVFSADGAMGSLLGRRASSSASVLGKGKGAGLIEGLLNAIHLMVEAPDWMASKKACAASVNSTLETLAREYTETHVSFILGTACDHYNIYRDFGGSEEKCKPVFKGLGHCFDTDKDYRGWCEGTVSLLGGAAAGGTGAASGKADKVAAAKAEMQRVKDKRARGEDIHEDLDKLKDMVNEAGDDAAAARTLEEQQDAGKKGGGAGTGGTAAVAPLSAEGKGAASKSAAGKDEDVKVGDSRFGGGGSYNGAAEDPSQNYKSSLPAIHPFGAENVAGKLTKDSVGESNEMVDQIEKAQVAEERRSAYRALTHLKHMTTASFDGIAHKHMQNIHEYGQTVKWRDQHPVQHLAEEEDDVGTWAFPPPATKATPQKE